MAAGTTLVVGATHKTDRYGYKAAADLISRGYEVSLFGIHDGEVMGHKISRTFPESVPNLDTVTLYINPSIQKEYYQKIIALKPKRIIFNPGTENEEFEQMCTDAGIEVLEACTLVMLSTHQF